MPRTTRTALGEMIFHVLNRANARGVLFDGPADHSAFERITRRTVEYVPMRILAYCLMPTHWHFVLWPRSDGDLAAFVHRLTTTHVRRRHLYRGSVGAGHIYQGTFKSFPIEADDHLLTVCRYVERNPVRAGLVAAPTHWPWSSALGRVSPHTTPPGLDLAAWPIPVPPDWDQFVPAPLTARELDDCRRALARGRPFGSSTWQRRTAQQLGLASTLRPRGRPRRRDPAG